MDQGHLQKTMDAAYLLVPLGQVGPSDGKAPSTAKPLCQTGKPTYVCCVGRYAVGQVVRPGWLEAKALEETRVVGWCMPAKESGWAIATLDEHTIAVLIVQVEGAKELVQSPLRGPADGPLEEGLGNRIVVDAFEEAKHTLALAPIRVCGRVFAGTDGPHRFAPSPGDEELGLATLEKGPPFRIELGGLPGEEVRDPEWVVAINAPGEGEKRPPLSSAPDGTDTD
jgi:hypothetical protein